VEAVIYEDTAVREAAVFGIPDSQWGEIVMACVVLKPGKILTAEELITHCRRTLANYRSHGASSFSETEFTQGRFRQDTEENSSRAFLAPSRTGCGLRNS